jgi:XTP/dITP diphosphohydrolase
LKLLIATSNRHKIEEIRAILSLPGIALVAPADVGVSAEVEEDLPTFTGNAAKKAVTLAQRSGLWAIADDSGLEVEALNGDPGVRSARYAGEPVSYEANNRKLLRNLAGAANRRARFRCAVALASPAGEVRVVEGDCRGAIVHAPRGTGGFGYDPLFVPDGYAETFSEMDPVLKNSLSHRGAAFRKAASEWGAFLVEVLSANG